MEQSPWYSEGLCFECMRCGNCCTGASGVVRVSDEEIAALAQRLGMSERQFRQACTRRLGNGIVSLREKANLDCIFYDRRQGCTVYPDRPRQCRSWPFWGSVADSPQSWQREARECPGMNQGRLYTLDEIQASIRDDGTSGGEPAKVR